ncbi:MAG TPA: FUSC family protein [Baekduia sp.]|nr:FUSC family protein [Baekduia sp.]
MSSREVIEMATERSRVTFRARADRLRRLAPTLLMGAVAAGASWLVAKSLFGGTGAFFAPVAAIITLGLTVGSRLNRAIELSVGVPLGIALADVLVLELGSGAAQLVGIVFLATAAAVFVGGGALLVTQAAVSAILVVTLQPPTSGLSFTRAADAVIGCGVALLLNFVVAPIDPMALVRRAAAPVLRELAAVLDDVAAALVDRDRDAAFAALRRARAIDAYTHNFLEALTIGRETATAAPVRRGQRGPLAIYSEAGGHIDLAVRNVRVLARGVVRAIETGDRVPGQITDALGELRQAVVSLGPWMDDPARADAVIEPAVQAARHASAVLEMTTNLSVSVIVGQVRSTAVDLLRTTGMEPEAARARIRGTATPVAPA